MRNLALITPWPPQRTGIADYAMDLAMGLAEQGERVSVFTDAEPRLSPHERVELFPIEQFPGPESFDHVVYQMGNNPHFHSGMLALLGRYGGIVHLHDVVLHHFVRALTADHGAGGLYRRLVTHWYGVAAWDRIRQWHRSTDVDFLDTAGVLEIPLFEPVLRYAQGCIVHSEFCRQRIVSRFPILPSRVIPQVYRGAGAASRTRHPELRIGMFGIVNASRHLDTVLMAAADAMARGARVRIDIAGNLGAESRAARRLVTRLKIRRHVTFHGCVDEGTFLRLMRDSDVCVALRYPTMGETSGVVARALQIGLPVIVNDVGWYAELPPFVAKLPVEPVDMRQQLAALLLRHATDADYRQDICREALRYAHAEADYARVMRQYLSTLDGISASVKPDAPKMPTAA